MLAKKYSEHSGEKEVFIIRPSTITGPRGRYMTGKKGLLYMLKNILPFVPVANDDWGRQYVHEDDITDIVGILTFASSAERKRYEVYNVSPNDIVFGRDMAEIFKKRAIGIPPFLVRLAFFFAWHLTGGKIPTGRAGWRFFSYPLFVDGRKVTRELGFDYTSTSRNALECDDGRYGYAVLKK